MGERRTWRKAEAVDDLTAHSNLYRMTAGVLLRNPQTRRGQKSGSLSARSVSSRSSKSFEHLI